MRRNPHEEGAFPLHRIINFDHLHHKYRDEQTRGH